MIILIVYRQARLNKAVNNYIDYLVIGPEVNEIWQELGFTSVTKITKTSPFFNGPPWCFSKKILSIQ